MICFLAWILQTDCEFILDLAFYSGSKFRLMLFQKRV
jgi:hypothetical protein